jgi:hypothetical protein
MCEKKTKEINEIEKMKGEKRVRNGKQRVNLLAFPLPQLSLFPHVISLPKGLWAKERRIQKENQLHCNQIFLE